MTTTKFQNVCVYEDDNMSLMQCRDGYWLYDNTRGMNLAMRAKDPQSAFVDALHYYQRRLKEVEEAHCSLQSKVESFVISVGFGGDWE